VGGEAAGGGDARRSRHRRVEQRLIFLLPTASHCCGGGRSFGGSRGCELMMTDWRCGLRRRLLARQAGRDGVHLSHPVLKAKPNALITCAPGSSYTHA
jgi:hypothetical protein